MKPDNFWGNQSSMYFWAFIICATILVWIVFIEAPLMFLKWLFQKSDY